MSKPDFNSLGITAELTLHERALRNAQNEITALKAENARLREQVRQAYAPQTIRLPETELTDQQIRRAIIASYDGLPPPTPPHHSTVGLGIDGEGRVQG